MLRDYRAGSESRREKRHILTKSKYQERKKVDDNCKRTGKAIPLQARTGPEGSRKMRLPDFKTVVGT